MGVRHHRHRHPLLRRRLLRAVRKTNRAFDVILGTPARIDRSPAPSSRPKFDDIGTRTARLEDLMTQVVVRTAEEAKAAAASGKSAEQFAGAGRAVAEQMQADVSKLPTLVDTSQTVDRARVEA